LNCHFGIPGYFEYIAEMIGETIGGGTTQILCIAIPVNQFIIIISVTTDNQTHFYIISIILFTIIKYLTLYKWQRKANQNPRNV
jgi:fructose-specific phosphotransferase system IIC component